MDTDGTGLLDFKELKQAFVASGQDLSDDKIHEVIRQCDYNANDEIDYTEFVAACMNIKKFTDDDKIRAVFGLFDCDGNSEISREDLISAMDRFGHDLYREDLDEIMGKHDFSKSGSISMAEFKAMLFDINQNDAEFRSILNRVDKMEESSSTASGQ